jgi:hypothetical protein
MGKVSEVGRMGGGVRHEHQTVKTTPAAQAIALLVAIQILCARGASLEQIHDAAEKAIEILNSRH